MAKSLQGLLKQIEQLQKQADGLRSREKAGVVARIKEAIAHYDITADELFGATPAKATRKRAATAGVAGKRGKAAAKKPGGTRPNWFKDALAAGKQAEDLLIAR